ncbi:uncharacterized protein NPIL_417421, partial [Nephila pilipes]
IPIVLNWKQQVVQSTPLNSYANLSRLFKDLKQSNQRSEHADLNINIEVQTDNPKGKIEIIDELEKLLNIVSGKTKKNPNLGPCITPECKSHYGMIWEELHPKRMIHDLLPAYPCDEWDDIARICWLNRNVGNTVTFVLALPPTEDIYDPPDVQWRQVFKTLQENNTKNFAINPGELNLH